MTHLFIDFSKAFDSIYRGKMEQILLAYGLPKETVTAIMMPYKNMKVKVCSPNGDRLWHCCWCSARGYISPLSVHNLPRLCTSNINRSNKRKWLYTKKGRKQIITHKKHHERRLCRWYSTSGKYTYPKPNPSCTVWSRQQMVLTSIWMQTKWSKCVLIKMETSLY